MRGRGVWVAVLVAVLAGTGGCGLVSAGAEHGRAGGRAPAESASASEPAAPSGVRGRVMRVQGAPGSHCPLQARALSPAAPRLPEAAVVSDSRGRYSWSLPEATYTLSARCGAAEGSVQGVEVVAGRVVRADIVVE